MDPLFLYSQTAMSMMRPQPQAQQGAADDVEEPDPYQGRDVVRDAGLSRIERDAEQHHAHEPEREDHGARNASERQVAGGPQADQDA